MRFAVHARRGIWSWLLLSLPVLLCLFPSTSPAQDSGWEKTNDRGNRYEGIVEVPNGKRDYELLAFFAYKNVNAPSPDGQLHLMFCVPAGTAVQSISAKEIHSDTQYMAAFKPGKLIRLGRQWEGVTEWPVMTVLSPNHVKLENIGVLVHLENNGIPGEIAPAVLYTSAKPKSIDKYSLYFVSHRPLRALSCTVSQGAFKESCNIDGSRLGQVEVSEPTKITFDAAGLREEEATVQLEGSIANTASNGSFSAIIHFFHQNLPQ